MLLSPANLLNFFVTQVIVSAQTKLQAPGPSHHSTSAETQPKDPIPLMGNKTA